VLAGSGATERADEIEQEPRAAAGLRPIPRVTVVFFDEVLRDLDQPGERHAALARAAARLRRSRRLGAPTEEP
jgi:hypothetical protein